MSLRLAVLLLALAAARAETPLTVHFDRVLQQNYLGPNAVYHGFAFMPEQEARGMSDADRAREFDRVVRMRLHIARTWYRPDWATGPSLANVPDWESPKMRAFYSWLAEMQQRNVEVALQAGWWFTRDTYQGDPAPDPARDLERYPRWVSDSVREIIETRGFRNVKYLVLFTEPTSYNSGIVPPGENQWSYYAKMVRAIDRRLRADGRRGLVKLVGPNNSSGGVNLKEAVAELNDVIDIYSGHTYNRRGYDEWLDTCRKMTNLVAPTGKPLWLDEMGKQDEPYRQTGAYGNYLAQVVAASVNAGIQTSLQWLLFDQLYVAPLDTNTNRDSFHHGVHRWGARRWPHDDLANPTACYPQWEAVSLMSQYLSGGAGTKSFAADSTNAIKLAATSPGGRDLTLMLVNISDSPQKFALSLARNPVKKPLYRHLYDPATATGTEAPPPAQPAGKSRGKLRGAIPANAVAIFTTLRP